MLMKVDLDLDRYNFAKRQLMKFVSDLEGFITPTAYITFPRPGG
jgi:hypothetical protein